MSTDERVLPHLEGKEVKAFQDNTFEIHCFDMKLDQMQSQGLRFSGPGRIYQSSDGVLNFTLYAKESIPADVVVNEITRSVKTPPGTIVPDAEYYTLTATDSKGRTWVATKLSPNREEQEEGTLCHGEILELTCAAAAHRDSNHLYLEVLQPFKVPYNNQTQINKDVAGRKLFSSKFNVLHFDYGQMRILLREEENSLIIEVDQESGNFPKQVELRLLETLQFVTAKPMNWSILIKATKDERIITLRSKQTDTLNYRIHPPIWIANYNAENFTNLFVQYFHHILSYRKNKIHPISDQVRAVVRSGAASIETRSLILCIAVESTIKHAVNLKSDLEETDAEWIAKLTEYLDTWGGPDRLSKRIKGFLERLPEVSATSRLLKLQELNAVTAEQIAAWKELRNKLAHGGTFSSANLQKLVNLNNAVLVLFYHIVFHIIKYSGSYTDYSALHWPMKPYPYPKEQN